VTPWSSSPSPGLFPATRPRPVLSQAPPPNPIAAVPDGRRVLSRVGVADHTVTPKAPWTGSGWREYSYGGFGGGHPHFRPHADLPVTQVLLSGTSAWESVALQRRHLCGLLAHGLSTTSGVVACHGPGGGMGPQGIRL
jgi:hypothetical protein